MNTLKRVSSYSSPELEEIQNLIQSKTQELVDNFQKKKEELIMSRLKVLGISFDLIEEKKRRFPRIAVVFTPNTETYYYNDGSIEGFRIITFKTSDPSPVEKDSNDQFSMSIQTTYY